MNVIYPISFTDGTCPHCGEKSLRFVDKFDHKSKDPIYPANKLVCINCDKEFFIRWIQDNDNKEKMIPLTCSDNMKDKFEKEIIDFAIKNRRKI